MHKRLLQSFVLLAVTVSLLSVATSRVRAQGGSRKVEITAKKFSFEPSEVTLKKGESVVLVLRSEDVAHGISFREFNINVKTGAGKTTEVPFTPDKTGDFVGHCSVFCGSGHGSMTLKLHVVD